jgi:hypothetical protein
MDPSCPRPSNTYTMGARWIIGIFSNLNSQFGKILEGLAMEDVGTF